jgi:uncharacterized membrane protein
MEFESNRPATQYNWFTMFLAGFTSMTRLSKTLWIVVIVKLIILFFILKPFFFPNLLDTTYDNDADKARHVCRELYHKAPSTE